MTPALTTPFQDSWRPRALGALRIVTGYLFITHGTAKLFGIPHQAMFDNLQLFSLIGLAGILEVVGGALMIVGLFTRPAAFILSGLSAAAYFIGHASQGTPLVPMLNKGELAALYAFVFLYFSVAGSGSWALDNVIRRKRDTSGSLRVANA